MLYFYSLVLSNNWAILDIYVHNNPGIFHIRESEYLLKILNFQPLNDIFILFYEVAGKLFDKYTVSTN